MRIQNIKFLSALIGGILFLDQTLFYKKIVKANSIYDNQTKNKLHNKNYLYKPKNKNDFSSKLNKNKFSLILENVFKKQNNIFISLIANDETKKEKFSVDLISDIQYQKDDVLYAEGNTVILFSDGKLSGDKAFYDKKSSNFVIEGNVTFTKGLQYLEASKLTFNFKSNNGTIEDVYGVIDLKNIQNDFDLNLEESKNNFSFSNDTNVKNLRYMNSATIGLVNDFEEDRRFNITDVQFVIPEVNRWRYKTNLLKINSDRLTSQNIIFTNDVFNEPQFLLLSKNFSAEKIDEKLKIVSRKSSIILDNKVKIPIGRRTIFDNDPISKWGIGSDYDEKDGFYISRGFGATNLFGDYSLRLRPYFLIQRALKGSTNSFREPNSSILSDKVENQKNKGLDIFALDAEILKAFGKWDFKINSSLNTLNTERFSEALRSKLVLNKSIKLHKNKTSSNANNIIENNFSNVIDLQLYASYREKVEKGFSEEAEIYFGKEFRVGNTRAWESDHDQSSFSLIYGLGEFKASNGAELINLYRNLFGAKYSYDVSIWKRNNLDETINTSYKFSPEVIKQGINWASEINAGAFFYSDGSSQKAISFSSGPILTFGSFNKLFLDYTVFEAIGSYVLKSGYSPFNFDNVSNSPRIKFNLKQQIFGPLVYSFDSYLNLDEKHNDFGNFVKPTHNLGINRRAYSLDFFYEPESESLGFKFNIFNFDYEGSSPKF